MVRVFDLTCTPPTITLGTSPSACASTSAQTVLLPYTATTNLTGTTNTYTIDYDAAANTAGFTDITTGVSFTPAANGGAGTINLAIPANAAAATYNGTITVSNAPGCSSTATAFTVTVNGNPTAPTVAGNGPVCAGEDAVFTIMGTDTDVVTYSVDGGGTTQMVTIGTMTTGSAVVTVSAPTTAPTITLSQVKNANNCTTTLTGVNATVAINQEPTVANVTGRTTCSGVRLDDNGATLLPTISTNGLSIGDESDAWKITNIAPATGLVYVSGDNVGDVPVTTTDENRIDNDVWNNPTTGPLDIVYSVIPTADNGCLGEEFMITVTVAPAPVASVSASAATVCVGDVQPTVTFSLDAGSAPATINYTVNGGTPTTAQVVSGSTTATTTLATAVAGTFTYTITGVTDDKGCTTTYTTNQPTTTVVVASNPTLTSAAQTVATGECNGADVSITVGGLPTSGTFEIDYNVVDDVIAPNNFSGTATGVTPDAAGEATFTIPSSLISSNNNGNQLIITNIEEETTTCSTVISDVSTTLIVNPSPSLGGTTLTAATDTICADNSVQLNLTGLLANTPQRIYYAVGTTQDSVEVTPDGNGGAAFTSFELPESADGQNLVIDEILALGSGCRSAITVNNSVPLVINPIPTLTTVMIPAVCAGDSSTATLTGLPASAHLRITYNFASNLSGGSNATVTSDANGTATIRFLASGNGNFVVAFIFNLDTGCGVSYRTPMAPVFTGRSFPYTVNPIPGATIVGTTTVCVDDSPQISFAGTNGTGPYTFAYQLDGTVQTPVTTGSITGNTTVAGTYVYTLTNVTDANGCTDTITNQIATLTVNPLPDNSQAVSDATVCAGDATGVTVTAALEGLSYQLQTTAGADIGTAVAGPAGGGDVELAIPAGTTAGTLQVVVTDSNNCSTILSDQPVLTVNTLPQLPSFVGTTACAYNSGGIGISYPGASTPPNTNYVFLNSVGDSVSGVRVVGPLGSGGATMSLKKGTIQAGNGQLLTLQIENTLSGCIITQDYSIDVLPVPTLSDVELPEVCSDEPLIAKLSGLTPGRDISVEYNFYDVNVLGSSTAIQTQLVTVPTDSTNAGVLINGGIDGMGFGAVRIEFLPAGAENKVCLIYPRDEIGTSAFSNIVQINPVPTLATTTLDEQVCNNAAAQINLTGLVPDLADQTVTYRIGAGTTQTATVNADADGEGNFMTGVLNSPANGQLLTIVSITSDKACNAPLGADSTAQLFINPSPTLGTLTQAASVCAGSDAVIDLTGLLGGTEQTITYSIDGGAAVSTTITPNLAGNGTITVSTPATFTAGLPVILSIDSINTVVKGCTTRFNAGNTVDLLLNATPTIGTVSVASICLGDNSTVSLTGLLPELTQTVTYNTGAGNQTASITSDTDGEASFTFLAAASGTLEIVQVAGPGTAACVGTPTSSLTTAFTVNSLPTATISGDAEDCQEDPGLTLFAAPVGLQVTFTGAGGTAPYTFTYNTGGADLVISSDDANDNDVVVMGDRSTVGAVTYTLTKVVDANGCEQAITGQSATLTVNALPLATVAATDAEQCKDSTTEPAVTFTATSGVAPFTFSYTVSGTTSTQTATSTGSNTTATVMQSTAAAGSFTYTLTNVTDAKGCQLPTNAPVQSTTVVINPLPTATIAGTATVCTEADSSAITFVGANGTAPYTFFYTANVDGLPVGNPQEMVTSTGDTVFVNQSTATAGLYEYTLLGVQDANGCLQAATGSANLTVIPDPSITTDPQDVTQCIATTGGTTTLTVAATGGQALTYQWQSSADGTTYTDIAGATITTYAAPTDVAGVTHYRAQVSDATAGCTTATSMAATVTINAGPAPAMTTNLQTACNNVADTIDLQGLIDAGNGIDADFTWTAAVPFFVTGPNSAMLPTSGSGDDIIQTYVNNANSSQTVVFTVSPTSTTGGCNGADFTVSLTIDPAPTATALPNGDLTLCTGEARVLNGASSANGATYNWTITGETDVDAQLNGSDAALTDVQSPTLTATVNAGATGGSVTVSLVAVDANGCLSAPSTLTFTIDAAPTAVNVTGSMNICGNDAAITLTGVSDDDATDGSFSVTPTSGASALTDNNDGTASFDPTGLAPGAYTITFTDGTGDCTVSGSDVINVQPVPTSGFTSTTNGLTVDFTETATGEANYNWTFGDNVGTSTSINPSYTYTTEGTYNVCLTVSNLNCSAVFCQDVTVSSGTVCDDVAIVPGLNVISFDVVPTDSSITTVFADMINAGQLGYIQGRNASGGVLIFNPASPSIFNTLDGITRGHAYIVRATAGATVQVCGTPLGEDYRRDLNAGINLIGYPAATATTPDLYFEELITQSALTSVEGYNNGQLVLFNPNQPAFFNTLNSIENGRGYITRTSAAVNGAAWREGDLYDAYGHFKSDRYNLLAGISTGDQLPVGELILIERTDGTVHGAMEVLADGYFMTTVIYGDDNTTPDVTEGMPQGKAYRFRYGSQVIETELVFTGDRSMSIVELDFQLETTSAPTLDVATANLSVYPSPFRAETTVAFELPHAATVSVRVLDPAGRTVSVLAENQPVAGGTHTLRWTPQATTPGGLYFVQLLIEGERTVQRAVIFQQ